MAGFFMTKKERYKAILDYFSKNNPEAETELHYQNPFQLLVAVMLSAQCTDKRVNIVTPMLFNRFPDAKTMSRSDEAEIFSLIRSISYPNSKSKHLLATSKIIDSQYNGEIPMAVDALVKLPGVGRKTANVITSVLDQQPNMAVDTHVFRVSERIGLTTRAKTPLAAEKQLLKFIPAELVHVAHHWLILHGRYTCTARSPKCEICDLKKYCQFFEKEERRRLKSEKKSFNL
jgi:endonuclease-3